MKTQVSERSIGQSTSTTDGVSSDAGLADPPVKMFVLEKFLSVKGLNPKPQRGVVKASKPTKLTAEALSKTYTKRRSGPKTEAQREALRLPDDVFSESVDAYVPRKRQNELVNLHRDEMQVNDDFLTETRTLSYEREVLDKAVCDREENRFEYEEKLWQLMVNERGLQLVEDGEDGEENQVNTDELTKQQNAELGMDDGAVQQTEQQ